MEPMVDIHLPLLCGLSPRFYVTAGKTGLQYRRRRDGRRVGPGPHPVGRGVTAGQTRVGCRRRWRAVTVDFVGAEGVRYGLANRAKEGWVL